VKKCEGKSDLKDVFFAGLGKLPLSVIYFVGSLHSPPTWDRLI
jgi:hypothetical protein